VEKDMEKAKYWYTKYAEQQHPDSPKLAKAYAELLLSLNRDEKGS
jgi:TPR repeat protein